MTGVSEPEASRRARRSSWRAGVAAIAACCVAVGAGGYFIGHAGSADKAAARAAGARTGTAAGSAAGARAGFPAGFTGAYAGAYRDAYNRAYRSALGKPSSAAAK